MTAAQSFHLFLSLASLFLSVWCADGHGLGPAPGPWCGSGLDGWLGRWQGIGACLLHPDRTVCSLDTNCWFAVCGWLSRERWATLQVSDVDFLAVYGQRVHLMFDWTDDNKLLSSCSLKVVQVWDRLETFPQLCRSSHYFNNPSLYRWHFMLPKAIFVRLPINVEGG